MQADAVPEGMWNLLAVMLQSRGGQLSDEKLQLAANKACLDARVCPQASKRLQELLAQHGLCQ